MDKKSIKNFAIEARKNLISEIKYQASLLGITAESIVEPIKKAEGMEIYDIGGATPYTIYDETIEQRNSLVKRIEEKGFKNVIEEVAYTWFNRIIAIRFMEVNDYLPTRVRVLSSTTKGKIEPDIVTESPKIDLNFSYKEIEQIYQLKNKNKLDKLFKLLFIKQCNQLNEILPELFEKTADYTELLLSVSFTNDEGVITQLIDNISENDFKEQIEIIGWLYQYYNTELKDDVFKNLKKHVKISKERIPAATQLFTPDWIVRYMVENSLGRIWLESHPNSNLKEKWKYYIDEAEQKSNVIIELTKIREESKNLKPEEINVIDPAMGSGHILIYAFEVLMQIYTSVGYPEIDAAVSILENNIYGLDIDDRAYQLAYFSVMMKARSYNRKILTKNIDPQICSVQESNTISDELIDFISDGNLEIKKNLKYLKTTFMDAKEYGSILDVEIIDFISIFNRITIIKNSKYSDIKSITNQKKAINSLYPILKQSVILSRKYDVIFTNPPYMGKTGMNKHLSKYLKNNFPNSKADISAVFIEKCQQMMGKNSLLSMITQHSFMFLIRYENLRKKILSKDIVNMVHLGFRAFEEIGGEVVQTTSFVLRNNNTNDYDTTYVRLVDFNSQNSKEKEFLSKKNRYITNKEHFSKIPGSPVAYWANENLINAFKDGLELSLMAKTKIGLQTGNNKEFLRFWHEIDINKSGFGFNNTNAAKKSHMKWFPLNKGGGFKKWYGNHEYMVNWENDGFDIKKEKNDNLEKGLIEPKNSKCWNNKFYFNKCLSWSKVSSGNISFRFFDYGFVFDSSAPSITTDQNENMFYLLGFLNSKICNSILSLIAPTMHYNAGNISLLPIIHSKEHEQEIKQLVAENIKISKIDWDSYETSWNFKIHPLIMFNVNTIKSGFEKWILFKEKEFLKLKNNEIELNKIFNEIYSVNEVISPDIDDKFVNLTRAKGVNDIKSFISYAVGCMFGRYSLDEEGLIYAGSLWKTSNYNKFIPDDDNIIPILDNEYFEDDIVGRFVEFVKVVFDEETLEENLDFISKSLKKQGNTSREIIRNYFLTDFYKDHLKTYKKHPIYWLFDSGKNNGFKALIYMHRYEPDTVARVRTDYLHKTQKALETAIASNERIIENSSNASEKVKSVKYKNILVKQLEETLKYDEALAHIANQKIVIDLDDGVKVNYAKFQGVEVSKEGKKVTKIDLLKKI